MNEFSLCIEYLLLSRESVSVPGLGTFVARPREAAYDEEEETLFPPRRQVAFSPESGTDGDSLLTDIQRIYSLPAGEAEAKLCAWTADFSQTLAEEGTLDFGSVGTFTLGGDGQPHLSPTQAGITAPAHYALDTFRMPQLAKTETAHATPLIKTDAKSITIRINKAAARGVAAACAAVALFFAFGTNAGNTDPASTPTQANAGGLFMPANLTLSLTKAGSEPATPPSVAKSEPAQPAATPAEERAKEEAPPPLTDSYCIVMASAVSRRNALNYVAALQARGYDTARTLEGKMLRVVVGEYATEREAQAAAREMHKASEEYRNAWVYTCRPRR